MSTFPLVDVVEKRHFRQAEEHAQRYGDGDKVWHEDSASQPSVFIIGLPTLPCAILLRRSFSPQILLHEIVIPQIHCVFVYVLYVYLCFIHKKSITLPKNQCLSC